MFQRRSRRSLKQAIDQAGDTELRKLQLDIQDRQEHIAQLEFEILDTNAELGRFENEYEVRVGILERQVEELEADLEQARFQAARRAQWGERADSPDMHVDVLEQFRRTWTPREKPPEPPPEEPITEEVKAQLKTLFRTLAKRFHPDLVTDPDAKRWRQKIMAQINEAYAAQDVRALKAITAKQDRPEAPVQKSRDQILADMRSEVRRLDGVIRNLERALHELINSHVVKLMLEVTIAARQGRDLLDEIATELRNEIAGIEAELTSLS
jgi:predicted  nucleic acid-binding Zn-ribbon protein